MGRSLHAGSSSSHSPRILSLAPTHALVSTSSLLREAERERDQDEKDVKDRRVEGLLIFPASGKGVTAAAEREREQRGGRKRERDASRRETEKTEGGGGGGS